MDDETGYLLSPTAAQRVAKTVQKVLDQRDNTSRETGPSITGGFWAKLTGESSGVYTWQKLKTGGGSLSDDTPTGGGAREVNGTKQITNGTRVWLTFDGYDGTGNPAYLFQFYAGITDINCTGGTLNVTFNGKTP